MQIFNHTILGSAILLLLGGLVAVKRRSTGTIFDKPKGNLLIKSVNSFNLFTLGLKDGGHERGNEWGDLLFPSDKFSDSAHHNIVG